jgi:transposase
MNTPVDPKPDRTERAILFDLSAEPELEIRAIPLPPGTPRLRRAERHQIVFRSTTLDALLADDHDARIIWAYVEGLDLDPLYQAIGSVERGSGRPAADPKILLALWLYATIEGVGGARELDRLCRDHVTYQWIAGDVSMNYHSLADFRTRHVSLLDDLLTKSVATLMAEGLVDLNQVAQDGMRVRANAGAASFRRRPTLEQAHEQAKSQLDALRRELEDEPAAANQRQKAARERAAAERAERIERALDRLPELEAKKKPEEVDKARCSTTDPEATVMKMADGGFRPAYNFQFATDVAGQVIVGVDVISSGSDAGQMSVMVEQIRERTGVVPPAMLVDGGFAQHEEIETVSDPKVGCTVYAPVPRPKDPKVDRHEAKSSDSETVAAWRARMATGAAKSIYKGRAATAECVNALARGRGLIQLAVRGLVKAKAMALWQALAHNVMRGARLRVAAVGKG